MNTPFEPSHEDFLRQLYDQQAARARKVRNVGRLVIASIVAVIVIADAIYLLCF